MHAVGHVAFKASYRKCSQQAELDQILSAILNKTKVDAHQHRLIHFKKLNDQVQGFVSTAVYC